MKLTGPRDLLGGSFESGEIHIGGIASYFEAIPSELSERYYLAASLLIDRLIRASRSKI